LVNLKSANIEDWLPKGHFTHEIEGSWSLYPKISHWSKRPRSTKVTSH
jgi:hypothetical protein